MGINTPDDGETCSGPQQEGRRDMGSGGVILNPVSCLCPTGRGGTGRRGGGYLMLASNNSSGNNNKMATVFRVLPKCLTATDGRSCFIPVHL